MKDLIAVVTSLMLLVSCSFREEPSDYLVRIHEGGEFFQRGTPAGYLDQKGDTIIPIGKYFDCLTDTIFSWGIVVDYQRGCIAIDREENLLFRVYWFDNGPDPVKEGLFRIVDEDGMVGYADTVGKVQIEPRFLYATPFQDGKAQAIHDGLLIHLGEYSFWESDEWFTIDKQGNELK